MVIAREEHMDWHVLWPKTGSGWAAPNSVASCGTNGSGAPSSVSGAAVGGSHGQHINHLAARVAKTKLPTTKNKEQQHMRKKKTTTTS
jgi:hypothetical protein